MTQTTPDGPHIRFDDPLLEHLTGEWKLTRTMGKQVEHNRVHVEWILNHQFLKIHMQDVNVPSEYEALVLVGYEHAIQRYVIYWLDTFGGKYSEKGFGTRENESIRFVFQYPDGLLHNTFTWSAENQTWHAVIEQQDEAGQWSVFARDELER